MRLQGATAGALLLFLAAGLGLLSPARAQIPGLKPAVTQPAASEPAAPPAPSLDEQVAQARADVARLAALPGPPNEAPLRTARQAAAERLLTLLEARQQQRDARGDGPDATTDLPSAALPSALRGPPPYSVLDVDVALDQVDGLRAQKAALELTLKNFDTEVDTLIAAKRKADETLRARQEQADRSTDPVEQERALAAADLARLQQRLAEQELAQADALRGDGRQRQQALDEALRTLEAGVTQLRAQQRLGDDEMAQVERALEETAAEATRTRREVLDQIARLSRAGAPAEGTVARQVGVLNARLTTLADLDAARRDLAAVWQQRRAALQQPPLPDGERLQLLTRLNDTAERLAARRVVIEDRIDLTRSGVQLQRARVGSLTQDRAAARAEQAVLDAQEGLLQTQRQVRDTLARVAVIAERTRADLRTDTRPTSIWEMARLIWTATAQWGSRIWEFELFAASDTMQVDGRTVTVERGITVGKTLGVVLLFAVGYWLSLRVSRQVSALMVRRLHVSEQVARVSRRWLMWIMLAAVLLLALRMVHIPLTAFAFLGGALAIGVGFGAQNVLKNLISGLIILFERKVRVGDIVTISGTSGTVTAVDLRATTVRDFDGIISIVPNSVLLENQVSNWSLGSPLIRRSVFVGVAYGSDLPKAMALLAQCAQDNDMVLHDPAPEVLLDDLGDSALSLKLQFWVSLHGARSGPRVDTELRLAICEKLAEAGILIAFPQRDLHLDLRGPVQVELGPRPAT